jgi:hypothetical protein
VGEAAGAGGCRRAHGGNRLAAKPGVPRLRRSHGGAGAGRVIVMDSQPFRAGLTFSGRPSGPQCISRFSVQSFRADHEKTQGQRWYLRAAFPNSVPQGRLNLKPVQIRFLKNTLSPATTFPENRSFPLSSRAANSRRRVERGMTKLGTPATNALGGPFKPSFGLSGRHASPQAPDVIRRACDFFDLFVFSALLTGCFSPPTKPSS